MAIAQIRPFAWLAPSQLPPGLSLADVSLAAVQRDLRWAETHGPKSAEQLVAHIVASQVEAETISREIACGARLRVDSSGGGLLQIGSCDHEARFTYFFSAGHCTHLRKVRWRYHPQAMPNKWCGPSTVRVALVNLASPEHPVKSTPLGIVTLGGHLKRVFGTRVSVAYFDTQHEVDHDDVARQVCGMQPHLLGLSMHTGGDAGLWPILKAIDDAALPTRPLLVLGGIVPSYAGDILHHRRGDLICVIGRGEIAIQGLVTHILLGAGSIPPIGVPGVSFWQNGEIMEVDASPFDIRQLGEPDWDALFSKYPVGAYQEVWIEGSSGCPKRSKGAGCSFCALLPRSGRSGWQARPTSAVLSEVRHLATLGVPHLRFADEDFLARPPGDALAFAHQMGGLRRELARIGIRMPTFDICCRADDICSRRLGEQQGRKTPIAGGAASGNGNQIRKLVLTTLKEAGLTQVYLGLESGSSGQMQRMAKGLVPEDNEAAIDALRQIGVQFAAGWIMIDPLMGGLAEIEQNMAFIERNSLMPTHPSDSFVVNPIHRTRVLEGSQLVWQLAGYGLLGPRSANLVEYCHGYRDTTVGLIAAFVGQWESVFSPVVYALKNSVAVAVLNQRADAAVHVLWVYLRDLKRLDLRYLRSIVAAAGQDADVEQVRLRFQDIHERLLAVRLTILKDPMDGVRSGRVVDPHGSILDGIRSATASDGCTRCRTDTGAWSTWA